MHVSEITAEHQTQTVMQNLIYSPDRKQYPAVLLKSLFGAGRDPYYILLIEADKTHMNEHQIEYLRVQLNWISSRGYSIVHGNEIVLLLHISHKTLGEVLEKAESMLSVYPVAAGLSNAFTDPQDMNYYCQQARHCAATAAVHPSCRIRKFSDIMIYDLLRTAGQITDLSIYVHPDLRIIENNDRKNHTDYLHTLEVFLQTGGNISRTAAVCRTHRNTIVHRIDQMKSMMHADLCSGEDRVKLWIGLKILEAEKLSGLPLNS